MYNQHYDLFTERIPTIEYNIQRFKKFGKIINRVAKNNYGQSAKIGKIERENKETVYIVFYPDGEFDRFESGEKVEYRPGWIGPDLTTNSITDISEMLIDAEKDLQHDQTVTTPKKVLTDAQRLRKNARARELYREKKEKELKRKKVIH